MTESEEDGEEKKNLLRTEGSRKEEGKKIKSISLLYYHYHYYTLQKIRFKSKSSG